MGTNGHKAGYEAGKGALRRSKREVKPIGHKPRFVPKPPTKARKMGLFAGEAALPAKAQIWLV